MSDVAIRVEGLGKRYAVARPATRDPHYTALRDVLAREARAVVRRTRDLLRGQPDDVEATESFWALRDVSFEVKVGERLGIIGRNGAGKSTLLKVLSRITDPTTGRIELRGRVASLLEVGTGFHPELTGRENIYLNGAVLGMTRAEIRRRFDEIVDFAEVERFLDTPVKRYSSGMYMRLAFAVAAHLEPEILVVDEVLAVGDAAFQRKCLGKMEAVGREGRTVLFVSHDLAALGALCPTSLLLADGGVRAHGDTASVVADYLTIAPALARRSARPAMPADLSAPRIAAVTVRDARGVEVDTLSTGAQAVLVLEIDAPHALTDITVKLSVYDSIGRMVLHLNTALCGASIALVPGRNEVACTLERLPLSQGMYRINTSVDRGEVLDRVEGVASFAVERGDFYATGRAVEGVREIVLVEQRWACAPSEALCESD